MQIDLGKGAAFAATGGRAFDKSLPAVVMLHGAGMDRTVWSLQARYLAHHGRAVLALDLPGHGKSAGPALGSIPETADWLGKLLEYGPTDKMFTNPDQKLTEDYVTGRFG